MGPLGREAYSQEQDGGRDATSLRVRTLGLSGHGGPSGATGRQPNWRAGSAPYETDEGSEKAAHGPTGRISRRWGVTVARLGAGRTATLRAYRPPEDGGRIVEKTF